jgi:hypothetical protein
MGLFGWPNPCVVCHAKKQVLAPFFIAAATSMSQTAHAPAVAQKPLRITRRTRSHLPAPLPSLP